MNNYIEEIKKSKFVAYSFNLNNLTDVETRLSEVKSKHKKASHICYAYVYNKECVKEVANDNGEPSGTAGYPILGVIKKKGLTNILVVVVRYFGGIKLGAGGLTRAYTRATAGVLNIDN